MDQTKLQQQKALAEQKNYQTLKKVTQLLFSVSLFSFLFAQPSWLHSSFSTLPFHLFNHTIDKNFMFLLCNGLLVFLANYSGLVRCLSTSRRTYDPFKVYEYGSLSDNSMIMEAEKPSFEGEVAEKVTDTSTAQETGDGYMVEEMEERVISVAEDEDGGEDEDEDEVEDESYRSETTGIFVGERLEMEEDEEGNKILSTEELNRKFDEFIRRMKEEITIDARRTLVVV